MRNGLKKERKKKKKREDEDSLKKRYEMAGDLGEKLILKRQN